MQISCASTANTEAQDTDPLITSALNYIETLTPCGFDHGYSCPEPVESDVLSIEADGQLVPGNYLKAWMVALEDFTSIDDLEVSQKQLHHYKFGFSENADQFVVEFQALLLPNVDNGEVDGVIRATHGRTTRYWINKSSMEIDKRLFYKG